MKNRLVVIGWMSSKRCYLNVPKDEALRRFNESDDGPFAEGMGFDELEFDNEFGAYAIHATEAESRTVPFDWSVMP